MSNFIRYLKKGNKKNIRTQIAFIIKKYRTHV